MIRDSIARLKDDLEDLRSMSAGPVAEKVSAAGFHCKRCGKCCMGRFGDNTVTVFPSEIRAIMAATGLGWFDVARPHESDDVDGHGVVHTFEWALRRKANGDCAFLEGGRCAVYGQRPLICRTYPMRLEGHELELYECDGLGTGATGGAREMAGELLGRQVNEAEESIALLEKYRAGPIKGVQASGRLYVVHDSEGSRIVEELEDGSFRFA